VIDAVNGFLNNALYVSILAILLSSLAGFYAQSRARDRCLRDFHRFKVTIENNQGKVAWGTLEVYSSGVELLYASEHWDIEGHVENSYILYAADLANLQTIYRFHDDQTEKGQQRRSLDIRRTYNPSVFSRAGRAMRNFFSTFKDAIVKTINTVLGYRAAQQPQAVILSKREELTSSGAQLLSGAFGNAYEPILERYTGHYVVLEILRDGVWEEEYGILKEYSAKYVELLNVKTEVPLDMYLKGRPFKGTTPVQVDPLQEVVRVANHLSRTILVEGIKVEEETRKVSVPIESGQEVNIELSEIEREKPLSLDISVRSMADLIVPRTLAVVRHAGKRDKLSVDTLLGLDDLPYHPWVKKLLGGEESIVSNKIWSSGELENTQEHSRSHGEGSLS